METVNVLGGNGFVGSEFCKTTKLSVIKNTRNDYQIHDKNVVYFISTVHNYNLLESSVIDIETNLITLMRVLDNYKKYPGEGCFNFISSWFVYGQDSGYGLGAKGIKETDTCDPRGFYSITKRCAEQLLISYCDTFNIQYRILRLANVLGANDHKVSAKKNALQFMINQLKLNNTIELYDSGKFYRDYMDVRDCTRAIDMVIRSGDMNCIYNIGNGIPQEFNQLIQYCKITLQSTSKISSIEQKDFHKKVQSSRSFFMNTDKLKLLGYRPEYSIFDTLDEIVESSLT